MNLEGVRSYCLALPGVVEETPFGPDFLVYKVAGKMFAGINIARLPLSVNLKCDPERAVELRERYLEITPGYHMNKRHWNTLDLSGRLPTSLVRELIDHSYGLVRASLPRKARETLHRQ